MLRKLKTSLLQVPPGLLKEGLFADGVRLKVMPSETTANEENLEPAGCAESYENCPDAGALPLVAVKLIV